MDRDLNSAINTAVAILGGNIHAAISFLRWSVEPDFFLQIWFYLRTNPLFQIYRVLTCLKPSR